MKPDLQTSWSFDTYNIITKYVCHLCKVLLTYNQSLSILRNWLIYFRWAIDCHIGRHKFQKRNTKRHRTFISTGFIANKSMSKYWQVNNLQLSRNMQLIAEIPWVASSRPVYYSILNFFRLRSQYISITFPLHKQSENLWMYYSRKDLRR